MRAAAAAKDTETLIAGIVRQVHEGADHVRQTNEEFAQMSGKIAKVGSLVTEIAAASGEQTVGFDQISSAMLAIDKVTQQTAASAEESASAATEMHAQAAKLQEYVGELLALIGRTHPAADPGGSAPGHEAGQRKEKVAPVQTPSAKRQKKLPERPQPAEMEEFENF
jgi:methyl-accepting chemotaxis protein